jgi:hypothetical protein
MKSIWKLESTSFSNSSDLIILFSYEASLP